jgi:hypothetical protein
LLCESWNREREKRRWRICTLSQKMN